MTLKYVVIIDDKIEGTIHLVTDENQTGFLCPASFSTVSTTFERFEIQNGTLEEACFACVALTQPVA